MADSSPDLILEAVLHGTPTSAPPSRVLKIMVVSSKTDFEAERRYLQERVWGELQRHLSGLDVEVLDAQLGNDVDAVLDPRAFRQQLRHIQHCHDDSLGPFLLCLIGSKYRPCPLPDSVEAGEFEAIRERALEAGLDVGLLEQWYALDANLAPPAYVACPLHTRRSRLRLRRSSEVPRTEYEREVREWIEEEEQVLKVLQYGARVAHREGLINRNQEKRYFMSGVYNQLDFALGLSATASQRIVCVIRQLDDIAYDEPSVSHYVDVSAQESLDEESAASQQSLIDEAIFMVNRKNIHYFNVPWKANGVDPEHLEHRFYLEKFGNAIFTNIKALVEEESAATTPSWHNLPLNIRKPIQEVVRESQSHLSNSRQHLQALGVSQSLDSDCGALLQIQNLMLAQDDTCVRHSPVIVCGASGSGKSTLLAQAFAYCPEWLGVDVVRIIRHVGSSPCSSFPPELLRNLCLHISLLFEVEVSPRHHSFELGKLSIWFQDLLKLAEEKEVELVLLLDDLHALRSPPSNQAAILGWLPWNLPPNVHILCSVAQEEDRILGLLKSRISAAENFVYLPPLNGQSALSMMQSNLKDHQHVLTADQWQHVQECLSGKTVSALYVKLLSHLARRWSSHTTLSKGDVPSSVDETTSLFLEALERRHGLEAVRKICSYLACTSFGLREAEVVELMASADYAGPGGGAHKEFSATDWLDIKEELSVLLKRYWVDGRVYLQWSHRVVAEAVRGRYLGTSGAAQLCHADLASAFHLGFLAEKEQKGSPVDESKAKRKDDWSDMLREIDEMWYHLMLSGDHEKLKQDAVCNFDFLLATTRGASISYTRSILEIVRCQMLDWEVELLYCMTKQSVDVLSQDPQQLATEIINWLQPFLNGTTKTLDALVGQAREWCQQQGGEVPPLLVPQNSWLSLSLPPQVGGMTTSHPASHMVATPDSQHAIFATQETTIEMHHLPSRSLTRLFDGHKARITCLHVTVSGRWLVSGSKDSEIIIWEVENGNIVHRFSHHSSGVQCLTTVHAETLVISGSDSGAVVVSRLDSGQVVRRLENHRGVVSSVAVNAGDDIFASASTDRCVCIWSLEDLVLLNTIHLSCPITHMLISWDSTFLLVACTDHSVHVRSLATGSDVHCLYGSAHGAAAVTALAFARDNCRCAVGTRDGRVHLFDVHSARLIATLAGHSDPVTSIQAQDSDRFLLTCGGSKLVVWNFFCQLGRRSRGGAVKEERHLEPVTCIAVSRDGSLALTGSRDKIVKVWQLNSGELHASLKGHTGSITCVAFSPNGLFAVSGSEDTTLRVWGLTLGLLVSTFQEHQSRVVSVSVTSDSRRVLSVDGAGQHRLWQADSGLQLVHCAKPWHALAVHANMVFAIAGKNDCSLKFWPVLEMEGGGEKTVSHSDSITCFTVTYDCQTIVTGSNDMSLKVWELATAKLTQVLVGHEGPVTCAAVAPLSPGLAVSGSADCNLIVWDLNTGNDTFTLRGHTETVTHLSLTLDGTLAVSASADNTLGIWSTSGGVRVGMLGVHQSIVGVAGALNLSQIVLQIANHQVAPLLRLHNNPTKGMVLDLPPGTPVTEEAKTPGHSWRGVVPQRVLLRGNLKREQSFDSFYWDLRSSSPKHHDLGLSLEDFRRAPFGGSRELVWDGRRKPPKHCGKALKKQQSMFACFPLSPPTAADPLRPPAAKALSRAASLEEPRHDPAAVDAVNASAVCAIS